MYGGVIAPPLIVGTAAGLPATDVALLVTAGIFLSGLATLQTLGIGPVGSRLPIVQGISFAGVSTMTAIAGDGGVQPVLGAIIVAGVIGFVVSGFFAQLVRLFPAVVTGSIITVIGLSLMPVAFTWAMGGAGSKTLGSTGNIAFAGLTLLVILVISRLFQGPLSRLRGCRSCSGSSPARSSPGPRGGPTSLASVTRRFSRCRRCCTSAPRRSRSVPSSR